MHVINVPIEPIPERYSMDWQQWFNAEFIRSGQVVTNVFGTPLRTSIKHGQFLDVIGTNHYKAQQLQKLCEFVENGVITNDSIIFFHDLWFPGLEMLAYMRNGLNMNFKITGILHAGTWDRFDFIAKKGMGSWARHLEMSWLKLADLIFVGTDFHKDLISNYFEIMSPSVYFPELSKKIKVTGLPIYPTFNNAYSEKINRIVFPHRLAPEKNPECFLALKAKLNLSNWDFVRTKDEAKTKAQYYEELNKSKIAVSFADQETFGIAMIEATLCGCFPVVPDRLSYSELYLDAFKYPSRTTKEDDIEEAAKLIQNIVFNMDEYKPLLKKQCEKLLSLGSNAIPNIVETLKC